MKDVIGIFFKHRRNEETMKKLNVKIQTFFSLKMSRIINNSVESFANKVFGFLLFSSLTEFTTIKVPPLIFNQSAHYLSDIHPQN